MIKDVLYRKTTTKEELNHLSGQLDALNKLIHSTDSDSHSEALHIIESLPELFNEYTLEDITSRSMKLQSHIETVAQTVREVEVMRITLPFIPSQKYLRHLKTIFQDKLSVSPIFDVTFDTSIIGGMVIDYMGKHLDRSVKTLISQYLTTHKNEILSRI